MYMHMLLIYIPTTAVSTRVRDINHYSKGIKERKREREKVVVGKEKERKKERKLRSLCQFMLS